VAAGPHGRIRYAIGVHVMHRGDWIVNGSSMNMVELRVDPPARAWAVGVPVRVHRLRVSVEDPAALLGELAVPPVAS
jgi:hypothetical protein